VHIELQLHQQFVAERVDQVGGVGGAAHMADLDPRARGVGQLDIDRLGVEARQFVFDRAQCFQHLPGEEVLDLPLRPDERQHPAVPARHRINKSR
jgi:hypothetical protein